MVAQAAGADLTVNLPPVLTPGATDSGFAAGERLYVTLGVFLLIAARDPAAHRSLILFAAWSSIAHAAVMLVQSYDDVAGRPELYGMSALLIAIGLPLIVLAPARRSTGLAAAAAN